MPELRLVAPPPRAELLRQLRARLADAVPSARIVADGILGAEAPIDFVAVEPDGAVVLLLVGERGEDLELIARAVAQRAWVERRVGDWLQLAPDLGLRPEAGVRTLLLCPSFSPQTRAAAQALGDGQPTLVRYHCVRDGAALQVLLEDEAPRGTPSPPQARGGLPAPAVAFRTGLTDADLGLSPDERAEFE